MESEYAEQGMVEAMKNINAASTPAKSGRSRKSKGRSRPKSPRQSKANPAKDIAKAGLLGAVTGGISRLGLPGLVVGTLAYPIMERLIYGSREDQMRDQFETQRKIEQEEMAKMGGVSPMGDMGGVAGGMMPQQEQGMYDLLEDERQTGEDVSFARRQNRALEGLGRSGSGDELDRLLAGQEARIRSIQSPRQLTPYEIMGIIGG
jgi:hypothetical protein